MHADLYVFLMDFTFYLYFAIQPYIVYTLLHVHVNM